MAPLLQNFYQCYGELLFTHFSFFQDLQENRVMMLYISGDAIENKALSSSEEAYSCGVATQGGEAEAIRRRARLAL